MVKFVVGELVKIRDDLKHEFNPTFADEIHRVDEIRVGIANIYLKVVDMNNYISPWLVSSYFVHATNRIPFVLECD